MENNDKLEINSETGLVCPSLLVAESIIETSIENTEAQKSNEISQNALTCIQKPVEVVKNDCSCETSTNLLRRTSFMKLFDPLHSIQQDGKTDADPQDVFIEDGKETGYLDESSKNSPGGIINKTVSHIHTHDTLICLESPKATVRPLTPKNLFSGKAEPGRKYTEEEFRQRLAQEKDLLQKELSQKYSVHEMTVAEEDRILRNELSKLNCVNRSYAAIFSSVWTVLEGMKANDEKAETKLRDLLASNEKLKTNIKTTKEDLCVTKSALSDIAKRYEMSKSMNESYKENEEHLMKNIESMRVSLDGQSNMNEMLELQTKDFTDKATKEVESAKKLAETQIMILEAQLKKSEIKVDSLEKDLEQAKSNSDKLGRIYEDLKEKFR